MTVSMPDSLTVVCDECGKEKDFQTVVYAGDGITGDMVGVDTEQVRDAGWTSDGDTHYCTRCSKKMGV